MLAGLLLSGCCKLHKYLAALSGASRSGLYELSFNHGAVGLQDRQSGL